MQMIKYLAEGTYGRVWKVREEGRDYALKNFFPSRFQLGVPNLSEMALCMNLDHPHIIKHHRIVHHQGNGGYGLLMDLADCDLYTYLLKNPNLERSKICEYFFQLCTAVEYTHKLGMAHYDIKPNNCLLLNDQVKLCDFGSSRFLSLYCHDIRPTLCPPEVYGFTESDLSSRIHKQKSFSALKVDLWSLGETLFFMLTGKVLSSACVKKTCNLQLEYDKDPLFFLSKYNLCELEIDLLLLLLQTDVNKRSRDITCVLEHQLLSAFVKPVQELPLSPRQDLPKPHLKENLVKFLKERGFGDLLVKATLYLYQVCLEEKLALSSSIKEQVLLLATCLLLCSKVYSMCLIEEELEDISSNACTLEEIYDLEKKLFLSLQGSLMLSNLADLKV
ncbi:protein kinase with cyclin box [Cedratvirus kamchatka]|uniref:Protein kinase with cyclin box n=1 Tax=Cedratvirus kamchatka TaxID=2716914 RepID=A0A6G8MYG2_9VIRU|nr:protein kinase with cyclin box [Cedratvirus kamchatka]